MTFDEIFPDTTFGMVDAAAPKWTYRLESVPYDERHADDVPAIAPISPCHSDHSSTSSVATVTGKLGNIECKYHVDPRVLGRGHHGSVRSCANRSTGQRRAVKSIRKCDPVVKPVGLAREIKFLREIKHQNIVRLVDVYEDAEYVHLVTDLCNGGELFDRIVEKSSDDNGVACFTEGEAARIMHQILTAVSYMHKHNIAHRDLKPENILFETTEEDSPIKIIDFGLSRKHFRDLERPMSNIVGTPYYIAPEVLKKRYDKSCDIWSVGVIAYILLCGYPPFNGADNKEVYDSVRTGKLRFTSSDWSGTSRETKDFLRRLLQRDPRKRMTADEALTHPWMANYTMMSDEDRQDNACVEVVFNGLSIRDSISCDGAKKPDVGLPVLPGMTIYDQVRHRSQ